MEKKIQRDIQRNIERIAKAPPEGAGYSCLFSFNRELSWIEFNRKVLEEAMDPSNPSLEQLKFLSIFYNNLDLADPACIDALYRTSRSGVDVRLQVRGICCLRPGIPGVSGNIVVTSLVGRYLKHARIDYFGGRGEGEMFIGSADLMPRNLDCRVEVPVLEDILLLHMSDNRKQRRLKADGTCERISPRPGEPRIDSRQLMMKREFGWNPPPAAILR